MFPASPAGTTTISTAAFKILAIGGPLSASARLAERPADQAVDNVPRPVSRRLRQSLGTPDGEARASAARKTLANIMLAHDISPLAAMRLRQGLTQAQLASVTGIAQPHISRLENGVVPNPDAATVSRLAAGLKASADEVLAALLPKVGPR